MTNIRNPTLIAWTAGFVRRWHTNLDLCDTVDYDSGHSQRCAILLLQFWPNASRDLIIRALIHDQGEAEAGDISYVAKAKYPELAKMVGEIEHKSIVHLQNFPWPELTDVELAQMKFVDSLDSILWMWRHKPQLMYKPEWDIQGEKVADQATNLGVFDTFDSLMSSAYDFFVSEP